MKRENLQQEPNAADLLSTEHGQSAVWHAVDASGKVRSVSARELRFAATAFAQPVARLLAEGTERAEDRTVIVALADPIEFLTAFFGVQLAGGVPAPAPGLLDSHPVHLRRVLGMVETSRAPLVITAASRVALARKHLARGCSRVYGFPELAQGERTGSGFSLPSAWGTAEWPSYVQYTSGSTAAPSPVVVRGRHLVAQLRQASAVYLEQADSVSVAWVPLHHDMGLVTGVLRPLWSGYASVLLQPLDFVHRPRFWLEQLTRWSATHTSAPNFGYALCAAKVKDPSGLNLERLRVARVAGELVRAQTLRVFSDRFAPASFDERSFAPSYGMAEATLTVTTCAADEAPREVRVSASAIRRGVVQQPTTPDDELVLISCGAPLAGTTLQILPEEPAEAASSLSGADASPLEGVVGEVWISGPQVVDRPGDELGARPGRRTGDIGFVHRGELVLLGRASERFQFHGGNYYCAELEDSIARACPEVRPGRAAVFASSHEGSAVEPEVVVLAELRAEASAATAAKHQERVLLVKAVLRREHGLTVHRVCWLKPHSLPVTTSGKLRRLECRESYERSALELIEANDEPIDAPLHAANAC